ncbi:hypothetical protein [Tabrizicola sp.]|uniref:hypothetical protein n=1 Tax=Tabrizicola sp. TaxID=2005166 RepID=UPI00286A3AC3|nr:hypothetical protein [Tabrizicola sp.]
MPARQIALLSLCLLLIGCGGFRDSRLNPFNWFGRSEPRETIVLPAAAEDKRPLVEAVLTMAVEPIPGGAIIRATGQTPTQGWWKADLVPQPLTEDGVLVFEFRLLPPITNTEVNTPRSREVTVGLYMSDIKLEAVREIVVQGATNARTARR